MIVESEDLVVSIDKIVEPRNEKVNPQEELNLPFIGLDDIEAHTMKLLGTKVANELKSSAKKFYKGDVLYSRLRPYLNKVWTADREGICSSEFIVFPENSNLHSKYLAYRLNASDFVSFANSLNAGDRPRVNFDQISKFNIPVTSFSYQVSIVAKIEELFSELDKGIESLQTAREQLKVYRQAVLKHAFEGKLTEPWRKDNADKLESPEQLLARIQQERDTRYQQQLEDWKTAVKEWEANGKEGKKPGKPKKSKSSVECFVESITVPNAWAFTSVGELNADIFDGPFGSNLKSNDYVDEGVRVIRLENIGMMQFIHDKYSFVTEEKYQQIKKHTVSAGDIIFSSFITEGIRVTQLPASIDRAINKADCFCIRLFGQSYSARFLTLYLSSRSAYHQVESAIHGIGRPRINTTQLKSFVVPLCSEAEQSQILAEIDRQMSEIDASDKSITEQLTKAETLRQSILKKAFSGQLVPQDPNDEPASELLARIQAEKAALSAKAKKTPAKRGRKVKEVSE